MTSTFRNVALLGATGTLGSKILLALNKAGYNVTAIQRADSTKTAFAASNSIKLDLSNSSALTAAFKGQDVVVSAVPFPRLATEKIWIDAAISADVKRIVPSEYSTNLENALSRKLPIVKDKVEIRKYIESLAKEGKVEWMSVNNGPFFVPYLWLSGMIGPNPKTKVATFHDGGNKFVGTSTLERIGEGVARGLLDDYKDLTKNQPLYIYSAAMTERKAAEAVAKVTGIEFEEKEESVAAITKKAFENEEKSGGEGHNFVFYTTFMFGDGYGGDFRNQSWNEKLGFKEMTDEEVEETIRGWLKAAEA